MKEPKFTVEEVKEKFKVLNPPGETESPLTFQKSASTKGRGMYFLHGKQAVAGPDDFFPLHNQTDETGHIIRRGIIVFLSLFYAYIQNEADFTRLVAEFGIPDYEYRLMFAHLKKNPSLYDFPPQEYAFIVRLADRGVTGKRRIAVVNKFKEKGIPFNVDNIMLQNYIDSVDKEGK